MGTPPSAAGVAGVLLLQQKRRAPGAFYSRFTLQTNRIFAVNT